jgi:hypothetical protein
MADIRVKDLTESAAPGADYYLLTDSATDGPKKVKTTNIVKPADIGAASLAGAETLTNKTISGADNTLSDIPNSALTNSSVTIAGHSVPLGGSQALAAGDLSNISNQTILANVSGASAPPAALGLSAILDAAIGNTQGALITRKSTGWDKIDPGTSGTFLKSQGAGANLIYSALPSGGGPPPVFDTFAQALAYAPAVAPEWIETAFYDGAKVKGSGGTYRKNGTTTGDLVITLDDGITAVGYDLAVERPIIAQYGAVNTLDDRAVWQAAISKLNDGDTLAFPAGLTGTLINGVGTGATAAARRADAVANGGLKALTCAKNGVTIVINGNVNFTSEVDDGFRFTGSGVKFIGDNGKIANTSGVFVADNSTDETVQWRPSLIRLEGDDCEVKGLHFLDHPTMGVWSLGSRAKIHHNLFEGGPTTHEVGEYTVQMFVAIAPTSGGGIGSDVSHNTFRRSAAGGAAYTAIFGVQPSATFSYNVISDMLEHGVYNYGAGTSIVGNHVRDDLGHMQAAGIQNFAPAAIIEGNHLDGNNPFIALQLASDCQVRGNRAGGVTVRKYYDSLSSDLVENLVISQNILIAPAGQFWPIDVGLDQPFKKLHILENIISGGGDSFSNQRGAISVVVTALASQVGQELLVQGNTVDGGASYSLLARRVSSGLITGNNFKDAWIGGGSDVAVRLFDSDSLAFNRNQVRDTRGTSVLTRMIYAPTSDGNSNISADDNNISRPLSSSNPFVVLPDAALPKGNTQDNLPLRGTFTMPNTDAQNFNHTAVRPGATITLFPKNKEAWDLQASANRIYVSAVSNGVFQAATSSGAAAGTTGAVFDYLIMQ